jgi:hypothetical protein
MDAAAYWCWVRREHHFTVLSYKCLNKVYCSCYKPLKAKVFFILYPSRDVQLKFNNAQVLLIYGLSTLFTLHRSRANCSKCGLPERSFKLSDRFERSANSFFTQFAHRSSLFSFRSENQGSFIAFERSLNLKERCAQLWALYCMMLCNVGLGKLELNMSYFSTTFH